ncbi:MAG: methyl-accepting chemotaxis protein [Acidobacteriota bacterium]
MLNRLKIVQKLTIICLVLCLPIVILVVVLIGQQNDKIAIETKERAGVEYTNATKQILINVEEVTGLSYAYLSGNNSFQPQLTAKQAEIDKGFDNLASADAKLGALLQTNTRASVLKEQWQEIKSRGLNLKPQESLALHSKLITELLSLTMHVADTSTLILDPELDSYYMMDTIIAKVPALFENLAQARALSTVAVANKKLTADEKLQLAILLDKIRSTRDGLNRGLDVAYGKNPTIKPKLDTSAQSSTASINQFIELLDKKIISATAIEVPPMECYSLASKVGTDSSRLYDASANVLYELLDLRTQQSLNMIWTAVASGIVVLIVAGLLMVLVIRGITIPLKKAVEVAHKLAAGDLSATVEIKSKDEIGQLMSAMEIMITYLREMAESANAIAAGDLSDQIEPRSSQDLFGNTFKKMLESLRTIVRDLRESAQSLGSAANELVAAASQQTTTITEQASSIQQITTTLDEIRAIVEQASDRARSVVQVAEQSLEISESGQQELVQVVDAMGKIKDQVEAIAENILDLSEKTIQIGEITSSVNDIAEQSNLLAVNAAIEATKAGEAGKGFGVVAVEVKNLASRSKKATTQVRSILAEIQKAANSTVMVTEEGSKRVETGVGQVYRIGANIKSLHEVIVESSTAARQIASATNQQVTGIEQIAVAMRQINQGTNDSVAGARQQNITAQNLSLLAGNLNSIVQRYRL